MHCIWNTTSVDACITESRWMSIKFLMHSSNWNKISSSTCTFAPAMASTWEWPYGSHSWLEQKWNWKICFNYYGHYCNYTDSCFKNKVCARTMAIEVCMQSTLAWIHVSYHWHEYMYHTIKFSSFHMCQLIDSLNKKTGQCGTSWLPLHVRTCIIPSMMIQKHTTIVSQLRRHVIFQ